MKNIFASLISSLIFITFSCTSPLKDGEMVVADDSIEVVEEGGFDAELAKRLGADEYGMAQYVIAFLKKGPNRDRTEEEAMKLQMAHLDNIRRLSDEGKLVLAGPFLDAGDLRGIYVFNVSTIEEARALTETDPAIQVGSLEMDLYTWYGSAALKEISSIHSKIKAKSFH